MVKTIAFLFINIVCLSFVNGWIVSLYWNSFVVSAFSGAVSAITLLHGIAFASFAAFLTQYGVMSHMLAIQKSEEDDGMVAMWLWMWALTVLAFVAYGFINILLYFFQ